MAEKMPPPPSHALPGPAGRGAAQPRPRTGALGYLGQVALYGAFAAFIGLFSIWPTYSPLGAGQALLRLSFSQPGKHVADCRSRSAEELARLAPTMRASQDCPRERSPIQVRIELDGQLLLEESFAPSGIHRDGSANAYRRLSVATGTRELRVQFKDDLRAPGFTHERSARLELEPGQVVLIDFAGERGGIVFR